MKTNRSILALVSLVAFPLSALGQYNVSWHTIDGGGQTFSTGGAYSLGGTTGQPDAGVLSGGTFTLEGGFWAGAAQAGTGVPAATLTTAAVLKIHGAMGAQAISVNLSGQAQNGNVTSEPRSGGVTELRIAFDVPPGGPGADPVALEEQSCAICPCAGPQADYIPYSGSSAVSAAVAGNELVLSFTPGLENARTYRLVLGPEVSSVADQSVELRVLFGDADSSGRVNAVDRSVIVGVWTSPSRFSASTDLDLSGATNAVDRSIAVGAWTGMQNCAP